MGSSFPGSTNLSVEFAASLADHGERPVQSQVPKAPRTLHVTIMLEIRRPVVPKLPPPLHDVLWPSPSRLTALVQILPTNCHPNNFGREADGCVAFFVVY